MTVEEQLQDVAADIRRIADALDQLPRIADALERIADMEEHKAGRKAMCEW